MFQINRKNRIGYEDLMREMEVMEHQLMTVDSSIAMDLMVLEAKIRERFQQVDETNPRKSVIKEDLLGPLDDDLTIDEIRSMIPEEIADAFPSLEDMERSRKKKKILETLGMAALFAVITAMGVFALASILQLALAWLG